jgi:hypothetical protein
LPCKQDYESAAARCPLTADGTHYARLNSNSFITGLLAGRDTIVKVSACGLARRKISSESLNTQKTKRYNLHNVGAGADPRRFARRGP